MKRLKITRNYTVNALPEKIFSVLTDFKNFPYWFPKTVSVRLLELTDEGIGSQVKLKPMEKLAFSWKLNRADNGEEIEIEYFDGVLTGLSLWKLKKMGKKTKLSITDDLQLRSFYFRLLPAFAGIEKLHKAYLDEIINSLEDKTRKK